VLSVGGASCSDGDEESVRAEDGELAAEGAGSSCMWWASMRMLWWGAAYLGQTDGDLSKNYFTQVAIDLPPTKKTASLGQRSFFYL